MYQPSPRGVAYLAAANFLARGLILTGNLVTCIFTDEMAEVYSAHVEVPMLLFVQSLYMIPIFILGCLIFVGLEKDSFNFVLYGALGTLLVCLIRYGAEFTLIIMYWKYYWPKFPGVVFDLLVDLVFLSILLLYVYFCLAAPDNILEIPNDLSMLEDESCLHKNSSSNDKKPNEMKEEVKAEKIVPRFQYLRRKQPTSQEEPKSGSRPSSFISLTLSSLVQGQEEPTNKMLLDTLSSVAADQQKKDEAAEMEAQIAKEEQVPVPVVVETYHSTEDDDYAEPPPEQPPPVTRRGVCKVTAV